MEEAGGGPRTAAPQATRWISLLLVVLVVVTVVTGVGSSTGLVRSLAGKEGLWVHVAAALVLVPLLLWHAIARRAGSRRGETSRRTVLRAGALGAGAVAAYAALSGLVEITGLPGARRRFTGSHEQGSFHPARMPTTIWLDDRSPSIDGAQWRLTVVDAAGTRRLGLADLAPHRVVRRATLDCTSGWYAHQDWAGAPVSALLHGAGGARSLRVRSISGYWVRFPVEAMDSLLLATEVGGEPLSRGHGFPVRLVAPDRRGFWWVKWVDRIELESTPWWWQPPFPLT